MRALVYICKTKDNQYVSTTSYALAEEIKAAGGSYEIKFVKIQNLNEEV